MKLTQYLNHAKYFWWGKGWGQKPRKNTDHFYYKMQWKSKAKRQIQMFDQTLPVGVKVIDPNLYVKQEIDKEFNDNQNPINNFKLPWPYSSRPIKGTIDDPNYKQQTALVYHRNRRIVEPIKLPLNFANSILENDLPKCLEEYRKQIEIDDKFIDYCRRRIEWSLINDCAIQKLPLNREFPYLDQRPPRVYGTTINRKENLLLQTLYELLNQWIMNTMMNSNLMTIRISRPHCIYGPIMKDNSYAIMDLECDFITLLQSINNSNNNNLNKIIFDPDYKSNTMNKQLQSIMPINWKVGFEEKNFYCNNFEFKLSINNNESMIHTIYLSNNYQRLLHDDDYRGRSIMFCYGYAMQQALKFSSNNQNHLPLTIQCLYTSPKDSMKIGHVLFQLNTINYDDNNGDVKNQVWFSEPRSLLDDTYGAIQDLLTIQSFLFYKLKN